MTRLKTLIVLATSLTACGGKTTKKQSLSPSTPAATSTAVPTSAQTAPVTASPHVGVSSDLAKQCSLRFASADRAPKFGYDDSELLPADRDVLQQVADCLTKGPLKGKTVQLVGRADPRGTDEYNLGLGSRRAETVRSYLLRLGVPSSHLSPTTRGEIDAGGSDETSWQKDRRVDLQLLN
jgi:peptidoglycan-associated lipoprotein